VEKGTIKTKTAVKQFLEEETMPDTKFEAFKIEWKTTTRFLGRNGWGKSSGVYVELIPQSISMNKIDTVRFIPLTSRGDLARCEAEVPREKIGELIEFLKSFSEAESRKDP
jgi:hypothetical protein